MFPPPELAYVIWRKVGQFFFANPTLILSLLYVYITGIGILSSSALYRAFGINIFDYAEIADFLLAAIKSPTATLAIGYTLGNFLVALPMCLLLFPWVLRRWSNSGANKSRWRLLPDPRSRLWGRLFSWYILTVPIFVVVLSFLWTTVQVQERAQAEAAAIKAGSYKPLVVVQYRSFSSSAEQVTERDLALIGATQKAVFFYDVNDKDDEKDNHTLVIPQTQIVSIEVPDRT